MYQERYSDSGKTSLNRNESHNQSDQAILINTITENIHLNNSQSTSHNYLLNIFIVFIGLAFSWNVFAYMMVFTDTCLRLGEESIQFTSSATINNDSG